MEMEGSAMRDERKRSEIWSTAMLPYLENPPTYEEFVNGERDKRRMLKECLEAWDKVDVALAANRKRTQKKQQRAQSGGNGR